MPTALCPQLLRLPILVTITAVLASPLAAQTPPVPNVNLTLRPDLVTNVWPADFNRDGRTDLIAGTGRFTVPTTQLTVAIGRGDGTFVPPRTLGVAGIPLGVGDMNEDGFIDVVFRQGDSLEILPGRGDGTFTAPRTVAPTTAFTDEVRLWAHVTDLDGDGHRDIIVTEPMDTLKFYRGNGDFTFKSAVTLDTCGCGYQPDEATSGDFNGDGRRDLAVASPGAIDIFINKGGTTFERSSITGYPFTDVTTRDLNNDGKLDLVVASGRWDLFETWVDPGAVLVMLGNGNGTFQAPVRYETGVQGTMSIVVGDFNNDGKQDVATGNRSAVLDDPLGLVLWDSVSILPGDGAGHLGTATTFVFGSVAPEFGGAFGDSRYQTEHHQLNTSDLNGDRRTDLIASPGALLFNRPAAANRAPSAFAGVDRTEFFHDVNIVLRGQGTDPDNHWLTYTWKNQSGAVLRNLPATEVYQPAGTTQTYTLTVDDGHGGVSSDSVTIYVPAEGEPFISLSQPAFSGETVVRGVPYTVTYDIYDPTDILSPMSLSYSVDDGRTFQPVPGCSNLAPQSGQCVWQNPGPASDVARFRMIANGGGRDWIAVTGRFSITDAPGGFSSADIGAVGIAGTTAFSGGTWTIEGSGADIWDRADEFRYVSREIYGNFTAVVRVASIENLDRWVKAGLMVRESSAAGSRHASIFATPRTERGLAFQRRQVTNGLSVSTAGPAVAPPGWLALGRIGDTISAYYRPSANAAWTLVGRETLAGLPVKVLVGLAVSSHVDGSLATAVFDNLSVDQALMTSSADLGSVGIAGTTTYDGVVHEVRASGADIWGTTDAFRLVRGDGLPIREITARVMSVSNTHPWAKAGVMYRQSPGSAQSPHVMVVVTPGKGVAMQYRPQVGQESLQVAVRAGTAPKWVRLTQLEGVFKGYVSDDGVTWLLLGTITMDWSGEPGLAVTSHNNSALTTAVFQNVKLRNAFSQ
jgi:hypothetical protein